MSEPTSELQARERATWQYRAVSLLRGNQTELGAVLLAVIGRSAMNPPQFSRSAIITEDGVVIAGLRKPGTPGVTARFWPLDEFTAMFSHLGDILKLSDADRIDLFQNVRNWIGRDERVIQEPLHFSKTQ